MSCLGHDCHEASQESPRPVCAGPSLSHGTDGALAIGAFPSDMQRDFQAARAPSTKNSVLLSMPPPRVLTSLLFRSTCPGRRVISPLAFPAKTNKIKKHSLRPILLCREAARGLSNVQRILVGILPTYLGGCNWLFGYAFEGTVRLTARTPILSGNSQDRDWPAVHPVSDRFFLDLGYATEENFCSAGPRRMQRQQNRNLSFQRPTTCRGGGDTLGAEQFPVRSFQVSNQGLTCPRLLYHFVC